MMKKVTIEITEQGWNLKAQVGDNVYEEVSVLNQPGHASQTKGDLMEAEWMTDELYEALNSFFCFDVANALLES
ncbi:hypothetical protein ACWKTZ_20005 [Bacillus cereus]|uniref:Uncharacterized protein n=2 Tax=Bacillus TaxID=1386 RepID=A0A9X6ZQW9_BACTU|nr:hypothetical protein COJ15_28260 [Bacillus thuringiensis]PGP14518.1 hypothetical protein COA01_29585 [Bacillus cereus]